MAHRSNLICSAAIAAFALSIVAVAAPARADTPKRTAQALVTQGIRLLERNHYDDALDKFHAAYDAYPSPKILLNIGSTLRDMGRLADAANTYARYLDDPGADPKRSAEVKKLLRDLDARVTLLLVDVTPGGAQLAIDDGPWVPVAGRMQQRISAGTHIVRAQHAGLAPQEVAVDGDPGAHQDVTITLRPVEAPPPVAITPPPPPPEPPIVTARANRAPRRAVAIEPLAPPPTTDDETLVVVVPTHREGPLPAGLQVGTRIDGRLRGAAAAIGLVVDTSALETEVSAIISHDAEQVVPGAYVGFRLHAGTRVRPFVGAGAPMIWSGDEARFAVRGSAGLEIFLDSHFAVLADLGVEHFFNPQPTYEATLFVPIVGLQGRL